MKIEHIVIRHLEMDMKAPFTTSFGTFDKKEFLLLEAIDADGTIGWGESVAFNVPFYSEETVKTNWHMLEDFLIPLILHKEIIHPSEVNEIFSAIRKNNMAKSALEGAIWDIYSQQTNQSLAHALGGTRKNIDVGISIGIQNSIEELVDIVAGFVKEGYKRIKVKIKPDWDVEVMRTLRKTFPDVAIMADANSAYRLADTELLKQLDDFDLMMIEQPLASDDIIDHAQLQQELATPICLDESIHSLEDARKAVELGSTKIINIKIGRVGGLTEAVKIHDYCKENNIPVWCGGMLESGVGRAHNVALTTLENFTLPGDTASSSRYFEKDIIEPEVIAENGSIEVPETAGIGYTVNRDTVESYTVAKKEYK
ncbi:o-succinylbenzoate synthase [Jeotgalicoccus halotolerans]|uniref:o-succinylbenzoate synthase n=2 Tax=Jeotgalicoccus TaxID=227979 RepID=A0A078M6F5_9STAP|nr:MULTISPECIES: o-succinylbenzoate synthase [Jeotgalicoccus]MBF0753785.1 o-succinylbenzoate synthase [Jeotgalicoccus nanhaiensis]TFU61947.1 o-succinylbenzoate synthase [Jeotgalicoccus nanhaiensis]CEA01850.1 o-succinylbenzoate synthase [Jeotgalicoccus saudimassiliensis]